MKYFTYSRVSTESQQVLRQEFAIDEYCKEHNITISEENKYSDKITGKTFKRENYQKMKSVLDKDSCLIILDLDRLGRNWDLIKQEWQDLTKTGVCIIVINCPLINVMPSADGTVSLDRRLIQEMMFTLLCYVSQKEVEKISIRTKEALHALQQNGKRLGKPCQFSTEVYAAVIELRKQGLSMQKIADKTGLAKSTITSIVRREM